MGSGAMERGTQYRFPTTVPMGLRAGAVWHGTAPQAYALASHPYLATSPLVRRHSPGLPLATLQPMTDADLQTVQAAVRANTPPGWYVRQPGYEER